MRPNPQGPERGLLRQLHEPNKKYLGEWLGAPAHIHHFAHRMANPPTERPQSRLEFQELLRCFEVPEDQTVLFEKFGYGVRTAENQDRLLIAWEAHTEYYSYQIWHIPHENSKPLEFGPITFSPLPISPLSTRHSSECAGYPHLSGHTAFSSGTEIKNVRASIVRKPSVRAGHFGRCQLYPG